MKKGIAMDATGWMILAVVIAIILLIVLANVGKAGNEQANFLANLFRFS